MSLVFWSTTWIGLMLWLLYGLLVSAVPVVVANSVSLALCSTMIYLIVVFRSKTQHESQNGVESH